MIGFTFADAGEANTLYKKISARSKHISELNSSLKDSEC